MLKSDLQHSLHEGGIGRATVRVILNNIGEGDSDYKMAQTVKRVAQEGSIELPAGLAAWCADCDPTVADVGPETATEDEAPETNPKKAARKKAGKKK